jgi:hypothetical protein
MKHCLIVYLVAFFTVGSAAAKVGDKAKNLKVLPPWTMKLCPTKLHATYDAPGALRLKELDADCALWKIKAQALQGQMLDFKATTGLLRRTIENFETEQAADAQRIEALTKQVKTEIAEKNKYKYRPNYSWLYISIGAAVAIAGVAFGTGVWLAKKN